MSYQETISLGTVLNKAIKGLVPKRDELMNRGWLCRFRVSNFPISYIVDSTKIIYSRPRFFNKCLNVKIDCHLGI